MPKTLNYDLLCEQLLHYLRAHTLVSSAAISAELSVSQPTVSRLLARLGSAVWSFGKARSSRYALRRTMEGVEVPIELFEVYGDHGEVRSLGNIYPLGSGFYFESTQDVTLSRIYPGLPYFLGDMRPTGFLGRLVPYAFPDLKAPGDIRDWGDGDNLRLWTTHGHDLLGNLLLGRQSFETYARQTLESPPCVAVAGRESTYTKIANDVLALGLPGSSAAGEQPKFLCVRAGTPCLVKFSPADGGIVALRIRDLLVCEHLAHQVISSAGHIACKSTLIIGQERLFLELERFDRTPTGGRIGLLSLASLDMEFIGSNGNWTLLAEALVAQKKLPTHLLAPIRWLEIFGGLIGNSDMHTGNLSFICRALKVHELAPAYDMLPMYAMPMNAELPRREFKPVPPGPGDAAHWPSAFAAAMEFWLTITQHEEVSIGFRNIAADNRRKLGALSGMGRLLPR